MRQSRPASLQIVLFAILWVTAGVGPARGISVSRPSAAGRESEKSSLPREAGYQHLEGPLSQLEEALFADAADGRWDQHSLLRAALVASGVNDVEALKRYELQMAHLVEELAGTQTVAGSPLDRARLVFEFMHRRILDDGYQLDCTDLARVLDKGYFNCVSASVLFNCLAGRFGLEARGLEVPGHAMSRLILPDGPVDVETTCPNWFRLMDDPQKQAEVVEKIMETHNRQGGSPKEPREISGVGLVATIYYNRGVDLLGQEQFEQAVAVNAKALRLDPYSLTARGNLLATLNNWAIAASNEGRHEDGINLLRQGIAIDPNYETFAVNYLHVHSQRIEQLCRLERFEDAARMIDRAIAERFEQPYFRQVRLDVYRLWARSCFDSGQMDGGFAVFDAAMRGQDDLSSLLEIETAEVNRSAASLVEEKRHARAVLLLDRALARQPDSAVLQENHRAAVMRWAQPAFLSGDYDEAIRRTTHSATPGRLHQTLVDNVRYGYHQWITRLLEKGLRTEARLVARKASADPFLAGQTAGVIPRFPTDDLTSVNP